MLAGGDWLIPRYLGESRYFKPPWLYWCSAISVSLLGWSEFALRLPCVLASVATWMIVADWAAREHSRPRLCSSAEHADAAATPAQSEAPPLTPLSPPRGRGSRRHRLLPRPRGRMVDRRHRRNQHRPQYRGQTAAGRQPFRAVHRHRDAGLDSWGRRARLDQRRRFTRSRPGRVEADRPSVRGECRAGVPPTAPTSSGPPSAWPCFPKARPALPCWRRSRWPACFGTRRATSLGRSASSGSGPGGLVPGGADRPPVVRLRRMGGLARLRTGVHRRQYARPRQPRHRRNQRPAGRRHRHKPGRGPTVDAGRDRRDRRGLGSRRTDGDARRLLIWLAAPWPLFELIATKLPHYVLPLFPPAAMLAGCRVGAT